MSHRYNRHGKAPRASELAAGRGGARRSHAAPVAEEGAPAHRSRLWALACLPVPLFLAAIAVLWIADLPGSFDSPLLLIGLNLIFSTLVSLFVAYLIARSFRVRGTAGVLMLGCGVVMWGLAGLAAVLGGRNDINAEVTVHNVCLCLSAVCHLSGALFSRRPERPLRTTGLYIAAGYVAALGAVVVIVLITLSGRLPVFFIQGQGGTPVRQLILASSVGMFLLTAVLLGGPSRRPLSAFRYWYTVSLVLIAVGLLGIMTQTSHGSALSWTGRAAQFLGGAYMLVAAIAAVRESHVWGISLGEALRESERRFKVLAAATFEGIAITEGGRFTDANEQLLAILGYGRDELIGMRVADTIPAEDRKRVLHSALEGHRSLIEHGVIRKDGTRIAVEAHGRTLKYHNRSVRITAIRDITPRKHAEQALRESEARYRALLDQAPDAVLVHQDGHVVYCNAAAVRLYGANRPARLLGEDVLERVHPDQREQVRTRIRGVLENSETPVRAFRHLRLDGREVPVETTEARVDWQGKPAVQVVIRDVTELRRAERRVHRQNELLAGISRVLHAALTCESPQDLGRTCLAVAQELTESRLGFMAELHPSRQRLSELVMSDCGWSACRLQGPGGQPPPKELEVRGLHQRVVLENRAFFTNEPATHPDSIGLPEGHPQLTAFLGVPMARGGQVTGIIGLANREGGYRTEDLETAKALAPVISEALMHKRAEDALRIAKTVAEEANAAKDQFLAVLSHELRTPLTPVLLTACLLERRADLPQDVHSEVQSMRRNVELEARIIDDLLDLTRIARGKLQFDFRHADLHILVRAAADICARGEGAAIQLDLAAQHHFVNGDPARLQQLFWNLLNNARKFTPLDGHIVIRSSDLPDGKVRVEVTDTGVGIEPDALPRIFAAFEQGDGRARRFGGLGLGLAICQAVADAHGGAISARSAGRDRGATFTVEFPTAVPLNGEHADANPATVASPPGRSLRVLVVEDHAATLKVIARLIQDLGHDVQTATDVASAMQIAQQWQFDLLVSDLGLPDGSGHDLMRRLNGRTGLRGIALSGFGMEQDVRQSREAGFDEHLTKPVDFDALEETIARLAAMSSPSAAN